MVQLTDDVDHNQTRKPGILRDESFARARAILGVEFVEKRVPVLVLIAVLVLATSPITSTSISLSTS